MSESNEEMKGNETKQDEPKREKVRVVDISLIKDFPGHPFLVKDDESMAQLVKSIEMNGVLNPVIARKIGEDQYELISGHRRKHACILLGIKKIPLIGREMSKEEAVIEMVDSNLQREHILPSEKARAYKMKMDAMKKQGERTDLTCPPLVEKLKGKEALTASRIGADAGDSHEQVRRYIRLNELTPELLEFVDEGKIGMRPAVELSYLQEDEMRDLVDFIDDEEVFPSHAQTIRMKALSKEGKLDTEAIREIMLEEKPNQKAKVKIPMERIEKYFPTGTSQQQMEDTISSYCPRNIPHIKTSFTPYIFTHDEISRFFTACDENLNWGRYPTEFVYTTPALFRLLYGTGLRISEALHLETKDVHLEDKYVVLHNTKNNVERMVPFSDSVCDALKQYESYREKAFGDNTKYFFANIGNRCWSKRSAYEQFRRILTRAQIPHTAEGPRLHDFRHTFSVHTLAEMSSQGLDLYYSLPILSKYLGHTSLEATDHYVRLTAEMYPELLQQANQLCSYVFPEVSYDGV